MHAHKSVIIANMGCIGGRLGSAGCGFYSATKLAILGITEALYDEVKHPGVTVAIIEPGYFRTNFISGGANITVEEVIDGLKPVMDPLRSTFEVTTETGSEMHSKEQSSLLKL